jgi:hypothetical protein
MQVVWTRHFTLGQENHCPIDRDTAITGGADGFGIANRANGLSATQWVGDSED